MFNNLKRVKNLLSFIPTFLMNIMLRATSDRRKICNLVKIIKDHPNWLGNADEEIRVRTNFGFELLCDRKDELGQSVINKGEWESLISRTIQVCLRECDFSIDVGANIGYHSLLMSQCVGYNGVVLAFEPVKAILRRLLFNINVNNSNNIIVQSSALSDINGVVKLFISNDANKGLSTLRQEEGWAEQLVLTSRLDGLLTFIGNQRIRLIKIDVEGYELHVLKGIGKLLENVDYLICEINPDYLKKCDSSPQEIFKLMEDYGFISYCGDGYSLGLWQKWDGTTKHFPNRVYGYDTFFYRELNDKIKTVIS
jgi:FkbM family methyltransferase